MINALFWLALIILFEATALYNSKKYSINDNPLFLFISILCYAIIPYLLYKILINGIGVGITNIVWNITSTLYGLFIGVVLFSEHISLQQKFGAILGTIGTILILWHTDN